MFPSRQALAMLLHRVGATEALLRLQRRWGSPWLPILTYHRVAVPEQETSLDPDVIDATPDEFARQVELLSRSFTFIDTGDLRRHFEDGEPLPRRPLMITFDDGYRDNFETALPILQQHGARAVFFITTRHIGDRSLFWWDRVAYLLRQSRKPTAVLSYPTRLELDLRGGWQRAARTAMLFIKERYRLDLSRFMNELCAALEVASGSEQERQLAEERLMTWEQVRGLKQAGMDVQSHTRTHRILHTLSQNDLDDELVGSRQDLERELGHAPHAVSYPVGEPMTALGAMERSLRAAGYVLGFTNSTGVNLLRLSKNPLDLRRTAMSTDYSLEHFSGMLAAPFLGHASR